MKLSCRLLGHIGVGFLVLFASQQVTRGQRFIPGNELRYSAAELPQDRNLTRGIRKAEERIARGEYTQALRFLDEVLAGEEDYFVVPRQTSLGEKPERIVGLKEKARQLLRDLSAEGRAAYLSAYAPAAQRRLAEALDSGQREDLVRVVQRYFHTPAGYEASMLLAQRDADAGQVRLAAMTYETLLRAPAAMKHLGVSLPVNAALTFMAAGDEQRAGEVLMPLSQHAMHSFELGGNNTKLTDRRTKVSWIKQQVGLPNIAKRQEQTDWLTARGNPSRDATSEGGFPHMRVRWNVRLLDQPRLERIYEDFASEKLRRKELTPVASSPLAIGNTVLIRTAHSLLAVDFKTGKRIWRAEPQPADQIEALLKEGPTSGDGVLNPESAVFFSQRLWRDQLYSSLSSDGRRAFVIRDLNSYEEVEEDIFGAGLRPRGTAGSVITNRLCAYDLATQGKLLWELDGASPRGEFSGGFFVGTPLAIGDVIYGLVEIKNAIWLYAANASNGQLTWKQQLVNLDRGVLLDSQRRLQNASPSYRDGMLVCPIGNGMVISVDLIKQSLAWAYRYEVRDDSPQRYVNQPQPSKNKFTGTWTDAAAVIVDGRVFLTPPESNELHCLDLHTGELLWKQPQKEMMKLACVGSQAVLLIGPKGIRGLRLDDGKAAWSDIKLAKGTSPSGSGFLSEGRYYLPLSSAEVVAIDLSLGKIVASVKARDGQVLGNLTCHGDAILANDGKSLQKFDQIEILRKQADRLLAESPKNVEALRTLGEIAYKQGRLSEAVSLLERAYREDQNAESTQEILAEALLTALDEDFAAYKTRLTFLEKLQDGSPLLRAKLLRIKANGLTQMGEYLAAVDACLAIYDLALPSSETFQLNQGREVAIPNWVSAQLQSINAEADPETRSMISARISERYKSTPQDDFTLADRVDAYFGSLLNESSRVSIAQLAYEQADSLSAQVKWKAFVHSQDSKVRMEASARLASLLHREGLGGLAREYEQQISGAAAQFPFYEESTGREFGSLLLDPLPEASWPVGRVEATTAESSQSRASSRSPKYGIRLERADEVLGGCRVFLSRVGELTVRDSLGRDFFRASVETQQRRRVHYRQAGSMHAVAFGNILVVSFGRQLAAFNTMASGDNAQPELLWQTSLASELDGNPFHGEPGSPPGQRPGSYRSSRATWDGKWIGVLGPVSSQGCLYQDQQRLVCVDPLDGTLKWARNDIALGCDLFGDEEYVFATPQGASEARVFSVIDGREITKVEVPLWREHLTTLGRKVICWQQDASEPKSARWELSSLDALTGEVLWSERFPEGTRVDVDRGRYLACVTQQGDAKVFDAEEGNVLVASELGETQSLKEVHLSVGTESLLLLTNSTNNRPGRTHVRPINPSDYAIINGKVAAFDRRTGEALWARPAELTQQGWPVTQPRDLPALVFVSNHYRHDNSSSSRQRISMLALDRRTGATLYRSDGLPTSGGGHFRTRVAEAGQPKLRAEMSNKVVQLNFTDDPRPPLPPAMSEVESDNLPANRGLSGIIDKLRRGN
ncbi:MAG: PQQ-binding-like beta-propeller repeat protein [Lacipirellulaceae bacterium]